jgi:hypothetical protein
LRFLLSHSSSEGYLLLKVVLKAARPREQAPETLGGLAALPLHASVDLPPLEAIRENQNGRDERQDDPDYVEDTHAITVLEASGALGLSSGLGSIIAWCV